MARVILDGVKDYEEALAFAEWFGYSSVELNDSVIEADLISSRVETGDVEMEVTVHSLVTKDSDFIECEEFKLDLYT